MYSVLKLKLEFSDLIICSSIRTAKRNAGLFELFLLNRGFRESGDGGVSVLLPSASMMSDIGTGCELNLPPPLLSISRMKISPLLLFSML